MQRLHAGTPPSPLKLTTTSPLHSATLQLRPHTHTHSSADRCTSSYGGTGSVRLFCHIVTYCSDGVQSISTRSTILSTGTNQRGSQLLRLISSSQGGISFLIYSHACVCGCIGFRLCGVVCVPFLIKAHCLVRVSVCTKFTNHSILFGEGRTFSSSSSSPLFFPSAAAWFPLWHQLFRFLPPPPTHYHPPSLPGLISQWHEHVREKNDPTNK